MGKAKDDSMSSIYERFAGTGLLKKICANQDDEREFKRIVEFIKKSVKDEKQEEYKRGYSDGVLDHHVLMMKEPSLR